MISFIHMKTAKQIERHIRGAANHRRIEILLLVYKRGEMTLEEISETLDCNLKTISGHTQKLVYSGLLNKKYLGLSVLHSLSPYGIRMAEFLKTFQ